MDLGEQVCCGNTADARIPIPVHRLFNVGGKFVQRIAIANCNILHLVRKHNDFRFVAVSKILQNIFLLHESIHNAGTFSTKAGCKKIGSIDFGCPRKSLGIWSAFTAFSTINRNHIRKSLQLLPCACFLLAALTAHHLFCKIRGVCENARTAITEGILVNDSCIQL